MRLRPLYWKEDGDCVVPATAREAEATLGDMSLRRVGSDDVNGYHVSTVFLCIDHNHDPDINHHPILFESMVFSPFDGGEVEQVRYYTRAEALAGHQELVKKYKENHDAKDQAARRRDP